MRDFIVKLIDCCSFLYWLWQHILLLFRESPLDVLIQYEKELYYMLLNREINRSVVAWEFDHKFLCQMEDAKVNMFRDGTVIVTELFDKVDIFEAEKYAYCILAAAEIQRGFSEEEGE